jgi:hypothetical protein
MSLCVNKLKFEYLTPFIHKYCFPNDISAKEIITVGIVEKLNTETYLVEKNHSLYRNKYNNNHPVVKYQNVPVSIRPLNC